MKFFSKLLRVFQLPYDICIDLGTANTIVSIPKKGILINEPSVVALKMQADGRHKVLAVGNEAKLMVGRTPANIRAVYPMKDGVIADYDMAEAMIKYFISKSNAYSIIAPRILICLPYGATAVDRKAIYDSAMNAGARKVILIDEPLAAAIGAGLPVALPQGSMIVDIGGGTTEIGITSLGNIASAKSYSLGGYKMDEAIKDYISRKFNIKIGDATAEKIKTEIGCAFGDLNKTLVIRGFDLQKGTPKEVELTSNDVKESLQPLLNSIGDAIKKIFENRDVSYDLCGDIAKDGVYLTGGGALLSGLDEFLKEYTGLNFYVAKDPLMCVIRGLEKIASEKYLN